MNMESVRILLEVVAGVIPNQPMPEYTKQFAVTSDIWYAQGTYEGKEKEARDEIIKVYGYANEYMRTLWDPQKVNWVRCDWIYL